MWGEGREGGDVCGVRNTFKGERAQARDLVAHAKAI